MFLLLWSLASCTGQEKPDPIRDEAVRKFKTGSVGFIIDAPPEAVRELAQTAPSGAFYAGLAVRARERAGLTPQDTVSRSLILFQEALNSPAPRIREEAARELILPVLAKELPGIPTAALLAKIPARTARNNPVLTLQTAALYASGLYTEAAAIAETQQEPASWDTALSLAAQLGRIGPEKAALRGKSLDFLLTGTPDGASKWAFREILRHDPEFFTEPEAAAVLGRFAVADSAYTEGLRHFRRVLEQNRPLFFQYPDLTGDLGRGIQYTDDPKAQAEGITLFLEWDKAFQAGIAGNTYDIAPVRFRVLYFLGRIERRRRNYTQGAVYFKSALPFAPDAEQEDATIWYILDVLRSIKPEQLLSGVQTYLERRHDAAYFSDVLDQLCRYLTVNRRWSDMLAVFPLIRAFGDGTTMAKYAYILGRALSEGYISADEGAGALYASGMGGLLSASAQKAALVRTFFRIAFEEGNASFYYRAMSASHLGVAVSPAQEEPEKPQEYADKEEMELLLGFFEFGAAAYSIGYIKEAQDRLSVPELRRIAQALTDHALWIEAIRLVNAYILREDYAVTREDLKLYYPRAYRDIIEKNAHDAGIPPEILYGLIRTESAFDAAIQSHVGAVGLAQLMPATAKEEAERIRKRGGPNYQDNLDLRDPGINVHLGASYLRYLLERMKSPMQALLSYNGGYNRVQRWRAAEPKLPEDLFLETVEFMETREYGKKVLGAAAAYGYLYFDMTMEAVAANIFQ